MPTRPTCSRPDVAHISLLITLLLLLLLPACASLQPTASPHELHPTGAQLLETIDLGTLGGDRSFAWLVNDRGQVAGTSVNAAGEGRGFLITPIDGDGDGRPDTWFQDADSDGANDLMEDLGLGPSDIPGMFGIPELRDLNNKGQLIGRLVFTDGHQESYFWDAGKIEFIEVFGEDTAAWDLNANGTVVGGADTPFGGRLAFTWKEGIATVLEDLGGNDSFANATNDLGLIVGTSHPLHSDFQAVTWSGTTIDRLPSMGEKAGGAVDVNNRGNVTGSVLFPGGSSRAVVWKDSTVIDLGTLGGNRSYAKGINEAGQVFGESEIRPGGGIVHAFFWKDGVMTDLGTLSGAEGDEITARAMNDHGQIVGEGINANHQRHAFLWDDGQMLDLGTLGGIFSRARAISNTGLIVGTSLDATGNFRATLWRIEVPPPTPEELIADILEEIVILSANGVLNHGESTSLRSKLEAAAAFIENGKIRPTRNILGAFLHQVEAFDRTGRIPAETANDWALRVGFILDQLKL